MLGHLEFYIAADEIQMMQGIHINVVVFFLLVCVVLTCIVCLDILSLHVQSVPSTSKNGCLQRGSTSSLLIVVQIRGLPPPALGCSFPATIALAT